MLFYLQTGTRPVEEQRALDAFACCRACALYPDDREWCAYFTYHPRSNTCQMYTGSQVLGKYQEAEDLRPGEAAAVSGSVNACGYSAATQSNDILTNGTIHVSFQMVDPCLLGGAVCETAFVTEEDNTQYVGWFAVPEVVYYIAEFSELDMVRTRTLAGNFAHIGEVSDYSVVANEAEVGLRVLDPCYAERCYYTIRFATDIFQPLDNIAVLVSVRTMSGSVAVKGSDSSSSENIEMPSGMLLRTDSTEFDVVVHAGGATVNVPFKLSFHAWKIVEDDGTCPVECSTFGHGTCVQGVCVCRIGYVSEEGANDCFGCALGFYGDFNLEIPTCQPCPGMFPESLLPLAERQPCWGHGECIGSGLVYSPLGSGICECDENWAGWDCNECAAGYFNTTCQRCADTCNPENSVCVGSGSKELVLLEQACMCDPGFAAPVCETPCPSLCSGHGVCQEDLSCFCDVGVDGGWTGESCDVCNTLFFGPNCVVALDCLVLDFEERNLFEACSQRGVCNDGLEGDGQCSCEPGFGGQGCAQTLKSDSDTLEIVYVILIVLLACAVFFLGAWNLKNYYAKKRHADGLQSRLATNMENVLKGQSHTDPSAWVIDPVFLIFVFQTRDVF